MIPASAIPAEGILLSRNDQRFFEFYNGYIL